MQWLRRRLITGFFVTIPLVISVAALVWIFGIIDRFTAPLATRVLGREVPGLGILITLLVVLAVGALATNVIGRRILARGEEWLMRVPVFRTIYAPVKQLVAAFSPDNEYGFKRVIMVEDPHRGIVARISHEGVHGRSRAWDGAARGSLRADEPSVPWRRHRVSAEQRVLSRRHGRRRHPHLSHRRHVVSRRHTRQGKRACSADPWRRARVSSPVSAPPNKRSSQLMNASFKRGEWLQPPSLLLAACSRWRSVVAFHWRRSRKRRQGAGSAPGRRAKPPWCCRRWIS